MNSFLPIGSVVRIKESDAYLMIIGYDYKKENKVFDYISVIHMAGIGFQTKKREEDLIAFNKSSLKEVCFIGYMDREVRAKLKYMDYLKMKKESAN